MGRGRKGRPTHRQRIVNRVLVQTHCEKFSGNMPSALPGQVGPPVSSPRARNVVVDGWQCGIMLKFSVKKMVHGTTILGVNEAYIE